MAPADERGLRDDQGGPGQLAIRNAFILGAPANATLPAGSSAGLFVALVNTGPRDRLIRVSAPGAATSVPLPARRGAPGAGPQRVR